MVAELLHVCLHVCTATHPDTSLFGLGAHGGAGKTNPAGRGLRGLLN